MTNIVLGVSGSIASIMTPEIVKALRPIGNVKVVLTKSALTLMQKAPEKLQHEMATSLEEQDLYDDHVEWKWKRLGDPIQHVELKKWGDVLVMAPLSANTLAKMAAGMCDNLLTSVYRAWQRNKPIVLAPAMNTDMWEHPVTEESLYRLRSRHHITVQDDGVYRYYDKLKIVNPIVKKLACGDTGTGALANAEDIAGVVREVVSAR